ncbi:glutamyl-tRNA(Gln) amidotransferase subunit C [bacterium BMS3Abin05]|nr:glutamyl-tRNA(Gln) amidotransferase subunit C [bacterium BMS3Abin05]GBE26712.1 glutamyl-tRNA(Gln) amidotransferase subunit C [bacterium BMS3Bbin03]HDZ12577.1 Asp-tRNA(Asn)/Glu-tRNA(Gln) amidotransferase subunit GatC [Bacteroidota bacterium]
MAITIEEVEKISRLAKLTFTDEEKLKFTQQLSQMIAYVEKLNELDTENVPPTYHVVEMNNVFREDVVKPSMPQEKVLANAPAKKGGYFSVPKVIAQD